MTPQAQGERLIRLGPMVRAICDQHLRCDSCEDLQQEVYVRLLPRLPHLREPAALGAYARSIARNLCIDELRRRAHRPRPAQLSEDRWQEIPARGDPQLGESDAREALLAHLRRLPPGMREVAEGYYLDELDYAGLARRLDLSLAAVGQRLSRARRLLRTVLTPPQSSPRAAATRPSKGR